MASPPDIEDVKATILEISNNPLPGKILNLDFIYQMDESIFNLIFWFY